jgi:outer membrane protein assembly factor BamD
MKILFFLLFLSPIFFAPTNVSGFKKIDPELAKEYNKAVDYFEKSKYYKAKKKFEEILPKITSYNELLDIKIYMAYCDFYEKDYLESSQAFEEIINSYPNNDRGEEVIFMRGYALYKASPYFELEQKLTFSALEIFETYLSEYPNGKYTQQVTDYIKELNNKLAIKMFESAKLYYKLEKYIPALVTLNNLRREYDITFIQTEVNNLNKIINESIYK